MKWLLRCWFLRPAVIFWTISLGILFAAGIVQAGDPEAISTSKMATAIRVDPSPPRIDGKLDDEVWQNAPVFGDFQQRDPIEGDAITEETTFQIAYDEAAVYVGVRCLDREPDGIVSRLTRRDGFTEADWVSVSLDPHNDRQSGCWFRVYASGSVNDGVYSDDSHRDEAWNGVWEVETAIDDGGWSAEYRIPYHVLRFSARDEYVWGLNVERHISRKQELDQWSLISKERPGWVSQFGQLEGIRDIHPPLHLELSPYAMGRAIIDGGEDYLGRVGADVRYGITSGISLNATVNPDFGQVEADPAVLNLTAFEDFFWEQRPFFVEGASVFQTGGYDLFYSRRLGRWPGYFEIPEDAEELERPEATTILGALKLTGKQGKIAFGLLEAVTAPEDATIEREVDGEIVRQDYRVEPLTNYLVGRVEQYIWEGTSKIGVLGTAVNRRDAASAYSGGVDWDLKFEEDTYNVSGMLAGSRAGESGDRASGYIARIGFDKRGGWLETEASFAALSPGIDLNDMGYLRRGDLLQAEGRVAFYRYTPWGPFRGGDISISSDFAWNYDGMRLENGFGISNWGDLRNYWRVHLHFGRDFSGLDDDDVRRDGPVIERLAENWVHAQVETDERKMFSFSVRPEYRRHDGGDSHAHGLRLSMELRPLPSMWFSMGPRYSRRVTDAQWVDPIEDGNGVHFVYGELDRETLDFTTRARMIFTPELSLELFLQPFIAIGDYGEVKELVEPETYDFVPFALDENRDFHRRSLRSNLVLRWEFLPGSTLFVVWSQSRSADLEDPTGEDLEFNPLDRLKSSFTDDGDNVFLTKVSYWMGG